MSPIIDDTMSSDVVSMAASAGAGAAAEDDPTPAISTAVTEHGKDDHPFFHYYGLLPHQQNMLQDAVRTGTYQRAIVEVRALLHGYWVS